MAAITGSSSLEPVFLHVGVGDAVLVEPHEGGWWVGQVIHCEGGARCSATLSSRSPTSIAEQCAP